jgi:hypothetical protein
MKAERWLRDEASPLFELTTLRRATTNFASEKRLTIFAPHLYPILSLLSTPFI